MNKSIDIQAKCIIVKYSVVIIFMVLQTFIFLGKIKFILFLKIMIKYIEYIHFLNRYPNDTTSQLEWQEALIGQECSPSQWVCINHFNSNDYLVSKDGTRFKLRDGAVPTIFDVFLIEVNDEEDEEFSNESNTQNIDCRNNSEFDETKELQSQNTKLCQEIEQLKNTLASQKIIIDSRIEYMKKIISSQSKNIRGLKNQLKQYNDTLHASIGGLNVNFLIFFIFSIILS